MKIVSRFKEYDVVFENNGSFASELCGIENAYYVISKTVYGLYGHLFSGIGRDFLTVLEGKEENKTMDVALSICARMAEIPAKRNAVLVSIGGGTIQDITGFVASVMYRGVGWVYVPTTLLSACDSCIGGKSSLNYLGFKNLLGTFYPPDRIHVWPGFFNTLSDKDYLSGLGEVVKFNVMSGIAGLEEIENNMDGLVVKDGGIVERFVSRSLNYKKRFIEADEFDRGERIKLNFAHTFGHAIEVVSKYGIPHGMAVAIGMIAADFISFERGWISEAVRRRIEDLLLRIIDIDIGFLDRPFEEFHNAIRKDKKQIGDSLTAVLIGKFGDECELKVVHDVEQHEIAQALEHFKTLYMQREGA